MQVGRSLYRVAAQGHDHVAGLEPGARRDRTGPDAAYIGPAGREAWMLLRLRGNIRDRGPQPGLCRARAGKQLPQARLVKANDHLAVYGDHRNTLLARNLHHLGGRPAIRGYILFRKTDSLPRKKLFRLGAVGSGWRRIDRYFHNSLAFNST